jgi:hypothetical protein
MCSHRFWPRHKGRSAMPGQRSSNLHVFGRWITSSRMRQAKACTPQAGEQLGLTYDAGGEIGAGGDGEHLQCRGGGGAVLTHPDGHVAWRTVGMAQKPRERPAPCCAHSSHDAGVQPVE